MPLHTTFRGRTVLYVDTVEKSTLLGGRPRTRAGTDTRYVVRAAANGSRDTVVLGDHATLDQAVRYCEAWQPNYGLLSRKAKVRDRLGHLA